jgi:hypothetical protein
MWREHEQNFRCICNGNPFYPQLGFNHHERSPRYLVMDWGAQKSFVTFSVLSRCLGTGKSTVAGYDFHENTK